MVLRQLLIVLRCIDLHWAVLEIVLVVPSGQLRQDFLGHWIRSQPRDIWGGAPTRILVGMIGVLLYALKVGPRYRLFLQMQVVLLLPRVEQASASVGHGIDGMMAV